MALFKSGGMASGMAMGIGFFFLAPVATKMLSGAGRPLLKETFKGGMFLYHRGRTMLAEACETFEDISAEARADLQQSKQLPAGSKK